MDVVTLVDNSEGEKGLANEWGLSLYIEANEHKILFDTGSSSAFLENSKKLGVDVSKVDMAILSHGHYDHAGGLSAFFSANEIAPLYLRTTADGANYSKSLFMRRYVGMDKEPLKANQARLKWIEKDTEIALGIHLLTSISDSEFRPNAERKLLVRTDSGFATDAFRHELVLIVKEEDGLSVVTGCGHLGVINMVLAAKRRFPDVPVKAVVGGFHLLSNRITGRMSETPEDVRALASRLKTLGCSRVITGHCTSAKASAILKTELNDVFAELSTGMAFKV